MYSAGKILWSAVNNLLAFARESPAFNQRSLNKVLPDIPQTWHLHHVFKHTIRHDSADRFQSIEQAIAVCNLTREAIERGYLPLELLNDRCAVCYMFSTA